MKYVKLFIINILVLLVLFTMTVVIAEVTLRVLQMYTPPEPTGDRSKFAIYDDLIGWLPKPHESGLFFGKNVSHNSRGLRNKEISYKKDPGKKRIIVLGDSFTWGYHVEAKDRFTDQLSLSLSENIEVINMGCSGYGTDQEYLFLKTEGLKYSPDLVIVNVHWDSDKRNNTRSQAYGYQKPLFSVDNERLVPYKNFPVPKFYKNKIRWWLEYNSHLWQVIRQHKYISTRVLSFFTFVTRSNEVQKYASPTDAVTLTMRILHEMNELASANNSKFLVVLTPNTQKSVQSQTIMGDHDLEELASRLQKAKIWMIRMEPVFKNFFKQNPGKNITFQDDRHWNATGHWVVSGAIMQELRDANFVFGN